VFGITVPKEMAVKQLGTGKLLETCPAHYSVLTTALSNADESILISLMNCVISSSDVMVLNEIIEQAAGRQSRASEQGGKYS
jgi:hypothetical protein